MSPGLVLILIILIFLGVGCGALWVKRRRIASYPKIWTHFGTPPKDVAAAMEVIWLFRPNPEKSIRWGGDIYWTEELPFLCDGVMAAGCVNSIERPELKISRIEPVERSALAHEVGHYLWNCVYGKEGEVWKDGHWVKSPEFGAWILRVNEAIKVRLGR
jgi:hypothetical protein